jgi:undecaprenyl pyrophosphate phosphatase UppP
MTELVLGLIIGFVVGVLTVTVLLDWMEKQR